MPLLASMPRRGGPLALVDTDVLRRPPRWPAAALMHLLVAGMQKTFLMLHDCCATACAHHMLQLLLLALCWCLCVADCSITMLLTRLGSLIEPGFVRTDPSLQ